MNRYRRTIHSMDRRGHGGRARALWFQRVRAGRTERRGPAPTRRDIDYDHDGDVDEGDLARAAQNPVGDLISLPFQNNMNFDVGPADRTQNIHNIQPVLPIGLSKNWNLITRTILPVISQPAPGTDRTNGLGDLNFTGFISPKKPGKVIWGVGPALIFPTATDDVLGTGQVQYRTFGRGSHHEGTVGHRRAGQQRLVGGRRRRSRRCQFLPGSVLHQLQLPQRLVPDERAHHHRQLGGRQRREVDGPVRRRRRQGVRIGRQPMNINTQVFYNVETPTNGARWQWRFQIQLLFPK